MIKRYITIITAVIIAAGILLGLPLSAYAALTDFDKTDILTDLDGATIDGKPFDIADYPYSDSNIRLIMLAEYAYSYITNKQDNYGLYLYIYNPRGTDIETETTQNKIQLSIEQNTAGAPVNYNKYELQVVSKTTNNDTKNLFYKLKVKDAAQILAHLDSSARRYDVSGVELLDKGALTATDYTVGGTYIYTGYAAGYGAAGADSTLNYSIAELETIELDLHHTFYRTETSTKGAGYQNQLDTVYFAVPNEFLERYGKLQRIKAEWYEYKTNDIVVTQNGSFYSAAYPYLGYGTIESGPSSGSGGGGRPRPGDGLKWGLFMKNNPQSYPIWGWNVHELTLGMNAELVDVLSYLFYVDDITAYDPYADIEDIGGVTGNQLYKYIRNYTSPGGMDEKLPIKTGTISADLFAADIDEYRKSDGEHGKIQQGYSYYDFDASVDLHDLVSWADGNHNFWETIGAWGFWNALIGKIPNETGRSDIPPIEMLKDNNLSGTSAEVSSRLLVNYEDVSRLRSFNTEAKAADKSVVLFRFAVTDYYSSSISITEFGAGFLGSDKVTNGQAYRARQSVFFDFDIIQLTFRRDNVDTVIPVVANPIDIVNPITPPFDWKEGGCSGQSILRALIVITIALFIFGAFSKSK